jgi:hypothetical protein
VAAATAARARAAAAAARARSWASERLCSRVVAQATNPLRQSAAARPRARFSPLDGLQTGGLQALADGIARAVKANCGQKAIVMSHSYGANVMAAILQDDGFAAWRRERLAARGVGGPGSPLALGRCRARTGLGRLIAGESAPQEAPRRPTQMAGPARRSRGREENVKGWVPVAAPFGGSAATPWMTQLSGDFFRALPVLSSRAVPPALVAAQGPVVSTFGKAMYQFVFGWPTWGWLTPRPGVLDADHVSGRARQDDRRAAGAPWIAGAGEGGQRRERARGRGAACAAVPAPGAGAERARSPPAAAAAAARRRRRRCLCRRRRGTTLWRSRGSCCWTRATPAGCAQSWPPVASPLAQPGGRTQSGARRPAGRAVPRPRPRGRPRAGRTTRGAPAGCRPGAGGARRAQARP